MYFNKLVPIGAYAAAQTQSKFIAPTGSDANRGTFDSPWLSIPKLLASLKPGQTGYARGGTYANTFIDGSTPVSAQGAANAYLTIRNYPGETPIFSGSAATFNALGFGNGAAYIIVDGLQFTNFIPTSSAIIFFGNLGSCHDIIVRRCQFTARAGLTTGEHGVYLSNNSSNITIGGAKGMGNIFIGTYPGTVEGAGVELFHNPASLNFNISYNVFDSWNIGTQIWDDAVTVTATGQIVHNTYINCNDKVDARFHSTLLVRDNAGAATLNTDLFDPNNSAFTTQDHNAWPAGIGVSGISAGPAYTLTSGNGIAGASDGTNCGWAGQNFNA